MATKSVIIGAFCGSVIVSGLASAADKEHKLVERIKQQIVFKSSASTPDEIQQIIQPFENCKLHQSGAKAIATGDAADQENSLATDCDAVRQVAKQTANAKLLAIGVTDESDRNAIVENSLLVAELNATGVSEYMRRYVR